MFAFLVKLLLFIPMMAISIVYHIPINSKFKWGDFVFYTPLLAVYSVYLVLFEIPKWFIYSFVLEYLILYNLDIIAKGAMSTFYYRNFLSCENPPDAWYMVAGFHKDNKNMKSIFSYNKCPTGFKTNGVFCEKLLYYEPDFCEVAQIYRKYKDENIIGLTTPANFNDKSISYLKKDALHKQKDQEEYLTKVKEHQNECNKHHKDKTDLITTICLETTDSTMKDLCHQQYCDNSNQTFCHLWKAQTRNSIEPNIATYFHTTLYIIVLSIILIIGSKYIK
jgi:hypothetical protein